VHVNNEVESYATSTSNIQLSGGSTLQIVPWNNNGQWTSGRIEGIGTYTPPTSGKMLFEASIRFGSDAPSQRQGLWPAFWLLGDAMRHGTAWPACGELDIMERVNGPLTGYGTAHCGPSCNDPNGLGESVAIPDEEWHTWGLVVDRTAGDWAAETITWELDGEVYHTLTGAQVGEGPWTALAHSALYPILNVAVGGDWPGAPNAQTQGGYGAMMEVAYFAVYTS
jgi:beta-glucanase (GH16 family)